MLTIEMINQIAKFLSPDKDKPLHYYFCCNEDHEIQIRTAQDNPRCPYCNAIMTYGRYF